MYKATIGVLGYYGYGNIGDEAIFEIIKNFLHPYRIVPLQIGFEASNATIARLNNFDFIILGGGGLIIRDLIPPFINFQEWGKKLVVPIGILGIGIEELDQKYQKSIQNLIDISEFFLVRDKVSKLIFSNPKVQVGPDLTFYKPFQIEKKRDIKNHIGGINLRRTNNNAIYKEWINSIYSLPCSKQAIPFSLHPTYDEINLLSKIDPSCPKKFRKSLYSNIDILIGTAFHSIVFAIQSGIPPIAINYQSKVRHLMEEANLQELVLEWNEYKKLDSIYRYAIHNKHDIVSTMRIFSCNSKLEIAELLSNIRKQIDNRIKC